MPIASTITDIAQAVAMQSDGKIVVVGTGVNNKTTTSEDFRIVRYNSDGSLDATFGNNGKVTTDLFNNSPDQALSLVIQSVDGKLVVLGDTNVNGMIKFALVRYNSDGNIDINFGDNGKVTTDFGNNTNGATSLVIQSDGKLIAGGSVYIDYSGGDNRFALARYNPDGNLDTSFGNGGKVITAITESISYSYLYSLVMQTDGKLVVGGTSNDNTFVLVRYLDSSNQPPVANAGIDQTIDEGQQVTLDGSGSVDPNGIGDIISYNWNFGDGITGDGVTVNHTYLDNGVYTATLTATDTAAQTSSDTVQIAVSNTAPVVEAITGPTNPQLIGDLTQVNVNFTDMGILDTHVSALDWGDENVTQGNLTESNGSGSVTGSHTYPNTGTYTVTLTVTDKDGGMGQNTFQVVIQTPAKAIQSLVVLVQTFNLQQGIENSLDQKLLNAVDSLTAENAGDRQDAVNKLEAFINAVQAQSGNQITVDQANNLIQDAQNILSAI